MQGGMLLVELDDLCDFPILTQTNPCVVKAGFSPLSTVYYFAV
jgi:hypothetical protein